MTKYLLQHRNLLMKITGVFIIIAFTAHFLFHLTFIANLFLLNATILGGLPILIQAYQALRVKVISIDLLVTLAIIGALIIQNYEEAAVVSFLFLFGSYLEQRTLEQTRSAIKELVSLAPETALKQTEKGQFEEVEIDDVVPNDLLLVKTGEKIPVDGMVTKGSGHVNESSITGESTTLTKNKTDTVFAGTILEDGTLYVKANKIGEDTTFGKIIELVEEAQDSKSDAERFIDRFSKHYTPIILILAIFVGLLTKNLELAVTILVLGCPGALVIGVPVSNVSGIGNGAKNGILFKGSNIITDFSRVDAVLFDKTGTLTVGKPQVSKTFFYGTNQSKVESYLVSVERESNHPLAKAIINHFPNATLNPVKSTHVVTGSGILANINEQQIVIGNKSLLEQQNVILTEQMLHDIATLEQTGNSIVLVAVNGQLELLIGIRDQLREGVKKDLEKLKKLGVKELIMLSGDNQKTVDLIAAELDLTKAYGHLLPEDKVDYIKKLQMEKKIVAFIGDGINDSPSLATADIGIAMGNGTDVAIETSNIVLMNSDFHRLPYALSLAKSITRNMFENIIIAVAVVFILLLSLLFSRWMNMAIGMFVHEGSILIVILNGMRLLRYSPKKLFS